MRHLLPVIALFGAGLLPARAADSPAQMVIGEDSIEERLLIPRKLEPGRYEVQCEAVIGVNGSARNVEGWVDTIEEFVRQLTFLPGYHEGKPAPMLYTEPVLGK